jgi:hypothetical protein
MEVEPPIAASIVRRQDIYNVSFPPRNNYIVCPVDGCTGRSTTRGSLRRHFMFKHPQHRITILEEAPLPRCARCDMHVPATALARGHGATLLCHQGHVLKLKRAAEEEIRKAREVVFSVLGVPLESVSKFLYLGRQLSSTDDDWPDVVKNLAKARKRWATISRVLIHDGATPRISAMFYNAVVQSVLLYGS